MDIMPGQDSAADPREAEDPQEDLRLAEQVREAVLRVHGVAGIGRGRLSEAATYWVDRKVQGIVVEADRLKVHVIAGYPEGFPLQELAGRLRERVETVAPGREVDIVIEDVRLPGEGEA